MAPLTFPSLTSIFGTLIGTRSPGARLKLAMLRIDFPSYIVTGMPSTSVSRTM